MTEIEREPARDPQDLERLLVERQRSGDIEGMVSLFESDAVVDVGGGRVLRGHDEMRAFYLELVAAGRVFEFGGQQPALINGDLALSSTRSPDGSVTAEIARRQRDGTWLCALDQYEIASHGGTVSRRR